MTLAFVLVAQAAAWKARDRGRRRCWPTPPSRRRGQLRKSTGSLLFERLGLLPVLIVMYLVFYGLTVYSADEDIPNFISSANKHEHRAPGGDQPGARLGNDLRHPHRRDRPLRRLGMLAVAAILGMHVSLLESMAWLSLPTFIGVGLLLRPPLNGVLVATWALNPFVVTLGTLCLSRRGLPARRRTTVLNSNIPSFDWLGNGDFLGIPWLVWVAAAVVLLSWFILRKTILGLHIYAVGGNPTAARLTGIKVSSILLFVYAINGIFSRASPAPCRRAASTPPTRQLGNRLRARRHRCRRARRHQPDGRRRFDLGDGHRR